MALTEAQLKEIAGLLFLLKTPAPTPLPKPVNTDDTTSPKNLAARMQPISTDARFRDFGIGVIDFAHGTGSPKVWLHNGNRSWRIASTGKLAILLAAVQLRDDVRKVKDKLKQLNLTMTHAEFDSLFATIWQRSGDWRVQQIGRSDTGKSVTDDAPRVSTIFDLSKATPDFTGADVPLDKQKLSDIGDVDLEWTGVPDLTFWELMWLTGAQSDDVASTACVSEIGVPYMKAVQRAYGLFNPSKGMHMLLSAGYSDFVTGTPVSRAAKMPAYRPLTKAEFKEVEDIFFETPETARVPSKRSVEPGSAAALTSYMIAMGQNKLADKAGCDTIKVHLADATGLKTTGPRTATSLIMKGVDGVSHVTRAYTKLGILKPSKEQKKKKQVTIRAEFAYVEAGGLAFAVLVTGIRRKKIGGSFVSGSHLGTALGAFAFNALKAP